MDSNDRVAVWCDVAGRHWRCRALVGLPALLVGGLLPMLSLAGETAPEPRFALQATLTPGRQVSACGRFALEASVRYAPEAKSADGRFALKAVNVPAGGCDPFPDFLFADGFEP